MTSPISLGLIKRKSVWYLSWAVVSYKQLRRTLLSVREPTSHFHKYSFSLEGEVPSCRSSWSSFPISSFAFLSTFFMAGMPVMSECNFKVNLGPISCSVTFSADRNVYLHQI